MKQKEKNEIIAAIGTPIGRGAISCIRISGAGSAELIKKLTDYEGGEEKHSVMTVCRFSGNVKDKIMAVVYYGDRSYTGEESGELYFHGGKRLTELALKDILDAGARIAEPGEFTRRAFLNGKIDLTQAEGIGDLIDADSSEALIAAYEQSEGKIRKEIDGIYEALTTVAAKAEVCIDYPEEDIEAQTNAELIAEIDGIMSRVNEEIDGYDRGRMTRDGVRVVITGRTNAGKSTLFNSMLKTERAIVSDEEGTTRDTIEERLLYKGLALVLVDTAGIRETQSKAEKLGIERSVEACKTADITVHVVRGDGEDFADEYAKNREAIDKDGIIVINSEEREEKINDARDEIKLNAKSGEGVALLTDELYSRAKRKLEGGGTVNNLRHYEALKDCLECLNRARNAVETLTADCVCADLMQALEALGKITGRAASESVIGEIFSKFCVGK